MLLQQQLMQYRLECVQEALNESRNEYNHLCGYLKNLIEMAQAVVLKENPKILMESKNETIPSIGLWS